MKDGVESQTSNNLTFGPLCDWPSITIGITSSSIPDNAYSVRYYRFFPAKTSSLIRHSDYTELNPDEYWTMDLSSMAEKTIGAFRLLEEIKL